MKTSRTAAALLAVAAWAGPALAQGIGQTATAELNSINGSDIQALMTVEDTGSTLTVTGYATGMDPFKVYVSLVYDVNSLPTGPRACLPTPGDTSLNFTQMLVGAWLPVGSSTRTLVIVKAGPLLYAPLSSIGTISVREDTRPISPPPLAPDPIRFRLRACGSVVPDP